MHVIYEDDGQLKAATVLADQETSLQVEAASGKRSKIKAANVLLRFARPAAPEALATAQQLAAELDPTFLWEVSGEDDFSFDTLAREYYGASATAEQQTAVALVLHASPMHFYKRGKGRYRKAPPEALRAALASVERKAREAREVEAWAAELAGGRLPAALRAKLPMLLYKPEKNALEWKALAAACEARKTGPVELLAAAGAIPSTHDYHFGRFVFDAFPKGTGFADAGAPPDFPDLPVAPVRAFSIDDHTTTEIDDAFSVRELANGHLEIGIHIAAPALAIARDSPLDRTARARLSTVYMPGRKITMLPDALVERFTLAEGRTVPAVSLYVDVDADFTVRSTRSAVESVRIADNLRLEHLEPCFTAEALAAAAALPDPRLDHACGRELWTLWGFAQKLQAMRGKQAETGSGRVEYTFIVEGDRITLRPRARGAPLDTLVAEMMIFANSQWGGELARAQVPAIYRAQSGGKVFMTTVPSPHQGLGVAHYTWASSPLRRMVDLINQRQIASWIRSEPAPYPPGSESMLAAMRSFELAYEAYAEAQRTLERYWSLVWIQQQALASIDGEVIRDNLIRLSGVPVVARVPSVPELPAGTRVRLAVERIDLYDLLLDLTFGEALA